MKLAAWQIMSLNEDTCISVLFLRHGHAGLISANYSIMFRWIITPEAQNHTV